MLEAGNPDGNCPKLNKKNSTPTPTTGTPCHCAADYEEENEGGGRNMTPSLPLFPSLFPTSQAEPEHFLLFKEDRIYPYYERKEGRKA